MFLGPALDAVEADATPEHQVVGFAGIMAACPYLCGFFERDKAEPGSTSIVGHRSKNE